MDRFFMMPPLFVFCHNQIYRQEAGAKNNEYNAAGKEPEFSIEEPGYQQQGKYGHSTVELAKFSVPATLHNIHNAQKEHDPIKNECSQHVSRTGG